jgi:uncharacterized protein YbjT (DUF2867 family)
MTDTILVTGSTGNVGSQVVKQLSLLNGNIRAAVQSKNRADELKNTSAQLVEMNFNRPETIRMTFEGVQKLFLLTPFVPNMVEISTNLVDEAIKAKVKHIVKQSVMGADLEADVGTMRLHRQAEKIIEKSGIPYTFLRPNEFMQNFVNFHSPSIKSNNAFYSPREDAKVSFVDVRDIAAVAVKALTDDGSDDKHNNKTYLITGPEALSYYQAAEILSNATDKKISYVKVSDEEARGAMKETGMNDWLINAISELSDYFRKGYASQVSSAVEEITGKKPISFSQFAKDYAEAFR